MGKHSKTCAKMNPRYKQTSIELAISNMKPKLGKRIVDQSDVIEVLSDDDDYLRIPTKKNFQGSARPFFTYSDEEFERMLLEKMSQSPIDTSTPNVQHRQSSIFTGNNLTEQSNDSQETVTIDDCIRPIHINDNVEPVVSITCSEHNPNNFNMTRKPPLVAKFRKTKFIEKLATKHSEPVKENKFKLSTIFNNNNSQILKDFQVSEENILSNSDEIDIIDLTVSESQSKTNNADSPKDYQLSDNDKQNVISNVNEIDTFELILTPYTTTEVEDIISKSRKKNKDNNREENAISRIDNLIDVDQTIDTINTIQVENTGSEFHNTSISDTVRSLYGSSKSRSSISNLETFVTLSTSSRSSSEKEEIINFETLNFFKCLLRNIRDATHYSHVVQDEYETIDSFLALRTDYQYLLYKLYTRQNKWRNLFEFVELVNMRLEKQDVIIMYDALLSNNLITNDFNNDDLDELLSDMKMENVKQIYDMFKLRRVSSKAKMIQELLRFADNQTTICACNMKTVLRDKIKDQLCHYMKIHPKLSQAFNEFYALATFTNPKLENIHDFMQTVLYMKAVFPNYMMEPLSVFENREEFVKFLEAKNNRINIEKAEKSKNINLIVVLANSAFQELKLLVEQGVVYPPQNQYTKQFCAYHVYVKTLTRCAKKIRTSHYEDVKMWLEFLIEHVESETQCGDWYTQLAWLYMTKKPVNIQKATELLLKAFQEKKGSLSEVQLEEMTTKARTVLRKASKDQKDLLTRLLPPKMMSFPKITIHADCTLTNQSGKKRHYFIKDGTDTVYMSVEDIAKLHYIQEKGYEDGMHCEGGIIQATFMLFFWEHIYDCFVPGTFISKYQTCPLDMHSRKFYLNRKEHIDHRLREIRYLWNKNEMLEFATKAWESYSTYNAIWNITGYVNNPQFLKTILLSIKRNVLADIYKRLVTDIKSYRSGLPDLFMWDTKNERCKFVEVKGESDVLQHNQKLWLKYLITIGADVEVCHVLPRGSHKKK